MPDKSSNGRVPFNFRLTMGGKMLLVRLGEQMGLTRSAVIEVAIRTLAREQGLPGGHNTGEEIEQKWIRFMEEDEIARSAEMEKSRRENEIADLQVSP